MTEQAEVPPPVFPPAAESGVEAPSRVLRWLLTLVLIAAIAGGGAWLYTRIRVIYHAQSEGLQQMTRDINALEVPGDRLESRPRSEERRVGKEGVRRCRCWWSPFH